MRFLRKSLSPGRRRSALLLLVVAASLAVLGNTCEPTKQPAPPPTGLTIAPTGLVFTTVGQVQQFVVTNNGQSTTGTLATSIAPEPGTPAIGFIISADNCNGNTLPAGNVCTLNVTLNDEGDLAATLTVADPNDGAAVAILGGSAT